MKIFGIGRKDSVISLTKKYDDKTLVLQAERALSNDPSIDNSTIAVACRNGVVTLTGNVRNRAEHRRAIGAIERAYERMNLKYDHIADMIIER
jgi:osmotically-inducible protein OsmY